MLALQDVVHDLYNTHLTQGTSATVDEADYTAPTRDNLGCIIHTVVSGVYNICPQRTRAIAVGCRSYRSYTSGVYLTSII